MAAVFIFVFLVNICNTFEVKTATHWMITESGVIESKLNSPLILNEPQDLLTFMNQGRHWETIHRLYQDLKQRQTNIDIIWKDLFKESNIEFYVKKQSFCNKVSNLKTIDWRILPADKRDTKEIPKTEYKFVSEVTRGMNHASSNMLDCSKISKLSYTEDVFDDLPGEIAKKNTILHTETLLPTMIKNHFNLNEFGEWTNTVLHENPESWLHYDLGSLYWRVKRDASRALECSRRAVHYAPKKYKDIALINMGTVLLQSMRAEAALKLFHLAVKLDSSQVVNQLMLANTFVLIGDFKNAIKHYDKALELKPNLELAHQYKNAVLCHAGILKRQALIRNLVYRLRRELGKYEMIEDYWLKTQTLFVKNMNIENLSVSEKITEITGFDIKKMIQQSKVLYLKLKFLSNPYFNENWIKMRGVYSMEGLNEMYDLLKKLEDSIESGIYVLPTLKSSVKKDKELPGISEVNAKTVQEQTLKLEISPKCSKTTETYKTDKLVRCEQKSSHRGDYMEFEVEEPLFPSNLNVRRNVHDFDRDPDWPSLSVCGSSVPIPNAESIFPVFMPFENKGLSLKKLLTDKIWVPVDVEHDLPWHPPSCPHDKDAIVSFSSKKTLKQFSLEVTPTDYLSKKLREYVDEETELVKNKQDAEIGQRIHAAMQKELAPKWLLYTLASLYWRVRNNHQNALNCLLAANKRVAKKYKDVVLASLASVFLEMGYFEEALKYAEEAYKINMYEPATNFILAELSMVKKHRSTQMFHLKQAVRVDPHFMDGFARNLLVNWACILKQVNELEGLADFSDDDGDICTQIQPGISVVCEKDGSNCHITDEQCSTGYEKESSTLVRLLEKSSKTKHDVQGSVFSHIVANMPKERANRMRHYENYQAMMKTVNKALRGCGPEGCVSITAEDLSMSGDDCTHQIIRFEYWLQVMGFINLMYEVQQLLPPDLTTMSPSHRKVPECHINGDASKDFFLERVSGADAEGWRPIASLMHQLTDTLDFVDYSALGARIAKYVDAHPGSWVGLLVAGWWCGAGGRGGCGVRCLAASLAAAPPQYHHLPVRALATLLLLQSKYEDGKHIAYLSFYMTHMSKTDAFFVAVAHTFLNEYDEAVWMYRYILTHDENDVAAKTCLHATLCRMLYGDDGHAKYSDEQ